MTDYYVLEVTLRGIKPRLWRRFMIEVDADFVELHEAIQDACGWRNCHLFQFKDQKGKILAELPGDEDDETGPDAMTTPIGPALGSRKGKKLIYIYDFGDWWEHDLEVIDVVKNWPEEFGRKLLAGERAFPPEDCGGIGGYEECVRVITGKTKDKERLLWLDGWDPTRFDFKETGHLFNQARLFLRAHYERGP